MGKTGAAPARRGANVLAFFQVPVDSSNLATKITFGAGGPFTIASVPLYWVECKRSPGDTLPAGLCSYTP